MLENVNLRKQARQSLKFFSGAIRLKRILLQAQKQMLRRKKERAQFLKMMFAQTTMKKYFKRDILDKGRTQTARLTNKIRGMVL